MKTKIDKVVLEMVKLRAGDAIEAGWDERARIALKEHQVEHAALLAVAEEAEKVCRTRLFDIDREHLNRALNDLAAVRAGSEVSK